jgi:hypothetical protein
MPDWDDFLSGRREYALLAELLGFVASRIGDEGAAKKFILDWYPWEDPFPWVFDSLEVPTASQDLHAAERYFWRKLEFVTINWKSSSAVYSGPRIVCRRDRGKEWPLFDDGPPVTMRANLVQFRVDIAIERLRFLRLAPSAIAPEPLSTPGPSTAPTDKPAGPSLHENETTLIRRRPTVGETKKAYSERVASTPEQARSLRNWLSANDDVWRKHGGDPVKPRRAKRPSV